ncbi:hypothetical protein GCM10027093_34720 [Paraburkholderia jirisanensis]
MLRRTATYAASMDAPSIEAHCVARFVWTGRPLNGSNYAQRMTRQSHALRVLPAFGASLSMAPGASANHLFNGVADANL